MKYITAIIIIIAAALSVFNFTKVDFNTPFKGDSMIAIIIIVAALCAIVLMLILRVSKQIEQKVKQRR